MNAYLDQRRYLERAAELRNEAASIRLARSAGSHLTARLAKRLRSLASRLDEASGASTGQAAELEELCRAVPSFR